MYARLVRYDDRGDIEAEHACQTKATTIGRDVSNMIQLTEGDVSKKHAVISQSLLTWIIRDMDSSNGVFVNGKRPPNRRAFPLVILDPSLYRKKARTCNLSATFAVVFTN